MKKLNKEQQQKLILAIMAVIGGCAAFWMLLLSPALEKQKKLEQQVQDARDLKQKQEKLINLKGKIDEQHDEIGEELAKIIKTKQPPEENTFLWTGIFINSIYEGINIPETNRSVSSNTSLASSRPFELIGSNLIMYVLKLDGTGTFHQWGNFVANFEQIVPFAKVKSIELTKAGTEENQLLEFNCQLSIPTINPEKMPKDL